MISIRSEGNSFAFFLGLKKVSVGFDYNDLIEEAENFLFSFFLLFLEFLTVD
jgi:hypothetical protein